MQKTLQTVSPNGKKKVSAPFQPSPQLDLFSTSYQLRACNEFLSCLDCRACVAVGK